MGRRIDVISLLDSGHASYDAAVLLQRDAEERVKAGGRETLFLLQHAPVVTVGRNASRRDLLVTEPFLAAHGILLRDSDRGGKLTYHGPGQLVAYPVLNLAPDRKDVRRYIRDLEEVLIRTAGDFGVGASRSDRPGRWSSVWVGNDKLAAIGVHLSRWVTTHGVALNVTTALEPFTFIVPCGIEDGGVTSLERLLLGRPAPSLRDVSERFVAHFADVFDRRPERAAEGAGVSDRDAWELSPGEMEAG
ncbi:MAG: lipoyl(octanoyl) transferase LipB [Acidithiobacillales bacterium]